MQLNDFAKLGESIQNDFVSPLTISYDQCGVLVKTANVHC